MSERLEQIVNDLVLKARESSITDTKDGGKQFNLEVFHRKFAELIVRECMTIAQEYDGAKLGGLGLIIAMRIETHFGVEE